MDDEKLDRLVKDGWKVSTVADFLGLTQEEEIFIELKLLLKDRLKLMRESQGLTQKEAAKLINSSQSRVAKMEAGDPSVSLDLLVRSLLALGATQKDIADAIAPPKEHPASFQSVTVMGFPSDFSSSPLGVYRLQPVDAFPNPEASLLYKMLEQIKKDESIKIEGK